MARDSGFNSTMPHPSPRTNPSADAENVWQAAVDDSIPAWLSELVASGDKIKFTPPAKAMSHWFSRRLVQA